MDLAVSLWRDDDLGTGFGDPVDEMIGVVSFVGDCRFGCDALDEVMGKGDVVALAGEPLLRRCNCANFTSRTLASAG